MARISFKRTMEIIHEAKELKKGQYDFIIEIDRAGKREWMWRLKGLNGEPLAHSEPIETRKNVYHMVARVVNSGLKAKVKDLTYIPA